MPKQKWVELFRTAQAAKASSSVDHTAGFFWEDVGGCQFQDARLGRRFQKFVRQLETRLGQSIPLACQDWTNTKAAYRFLSNRRVSEGPILSGHFQATRDRVAATDGPILILHDTTEFVYYGESAQTLGVLKKGFKGGAESRGTRRPDALKPGGDTGRATTRADRDQVLEPEQVQGHERTQAVGEPDSRAD